MSQFNHPANSQLILALSKGRIFEDTLPLLEAAGIDGHPSHKGKSAFGAGRVAVISESCGHGNADIARRDARDSGRADAPLVQAADAHLLDTSEMTIEHAFREARRLVEQALGR